MLLIFATRYDRVTKRTFDIARRLERLATELQIDVDTMFEWHAPETGLADVLQDRFQVIAFYGHGDADGNLIGQNRAPYWTLEAIPNLGRRAVFAHACRAMLQLQKQSAGLNAGLIVGYSVDLITPAEGSNDFWECYAEVHSLFPIRLAMRVEVTKIRDEFYALCTDKVHTLNSFGARLMELVAIQQSRDSLEIVQKP